MTIPAPVFCNNVAKLSLKILVKFKCKHISCVYIWKCVLFYMYCLYHYDTADIICLSLVLLFYWYYAYFVYCEFCHFYILYIRINCMLFLALYLLYKCSCTLCGMNKGVSSDNIDVVVHYVTTGGQ